jgi:hypothetical protein
MTTMTANHIELVSATYSKDNNGPKSISIHQLAGAPTIVKVDRHLAQVYALQEPLLDAKYQIALLLRQLE